MRISSPSPFGSEIFPQWLHIYALLFPLEAALVIATLPSPYPLLFCSSHLSSRDWSFPFMNCAFSPLSVFPQTDWGEPLNRSSGAKGECIPPRVFACEWQPKECVSIMANNKYQSSIPYWMHLLDFIPFSDKVAGGWVTFLPFSFSSYALAVCLDY